MIRDKVVDLFDRRYGYRPSCLVRAPGRVNLMGDHTDYNDGFVLPVATENATWIAGAARPDRLIRLTSSGIGDVELGLDRLEPTGSWADYVAGTIRELPFDLERGFDALVTTTIPIGAGLSSSAALEVGFGRLVYELASSKWDPIACAQAAQRAENEFVGIPCGIMDQLTVATARANNALLLDCRSLAARNVPLPGRLAIVILDTGTRRQLSESSYSMRLSECTRAARSLNVAALRDVDSQMLETGSLDPTLMRRVRHVVLENARTLDMALAMEAGDSSQIGHLMAQSHTSLRDDFEVSTTALDTICDIASRHPACVGARMTGGGFGGSAVAFVETEFLPDFLAFVTDAYQTAAGASPLLYPTSASGGVSLE